MSLSAVKFRYEDWQAAERLRKTRRADLRRAVEKARKTYTLQEIGEVLGMTRQGVYDLLKR